MERVSPNTVFRHCEERSDEAISRNAGDCHAPTEVGARNDAGGIRRLAPAAALADSRTPAILGGRL